MAYYNFYRIIKDIIQTLFNKRILKLILLVIIIAIILFILDKNTVSADTQNTIIIDDISFVLPDNLSYSNTYILNVGSVNYGKSFVLVNCYYPLYQITNEIIQETNYTKYGYKSLNSQNGVPVSPFKTVYFFIASKSNNIVDFSSSTKETGDRISYTTSNPIYSNVDIYSATASANYTSYTLGNLFFGANNNNYKYPEFTNADTDIQTFSYNYLYINPYDYGFQDNLYLHRLEVSQIINSGGTDIYYYGDKAFLMNENTEYYNSNLNGYYSIPYYSLEFNLNKQYYLVLSNSPNPITNTTGVISSDINNGIYQVIAANSTNYLSPDDVIIANQNNNNYQTSQTNNTISNIDDFLNDTNYDDENIDESLSNLSGSTDNVDNTEYVGLFSTIFEKFSNLINSNYNEVEEIHLYLPFVQNNASIVLTSDLLSSHIQNTALMPIINSAWLFVFGMYIFKFSNNLIIKIKDGSILNGYSNNNEVITSTML